MARRVWQQGELGEAHSISSASSPADRESRWRMSMIVVYWRRNESQKVVPEVLPEIYVFRPMRRAFILLKVYVEARAPRPHLPARICEPSRANVICISARGCHRKARS